MKQPEPPNLGTVEFHFAGASERTPSTITNCRSAICATRLVTGNDNQLCKQRQISFIWLFLIQKQGHDNVLFCRQDRQKIKLLEDETDALAAKAGQFLIAEAVNVFTVISQSAGTFSSTRNRVILAAPMP